MQDKYTLEVLVEASKKIVWGLITNPKSIQKWYAFGGAIVDLRTGGKIIFSWDEHGKYHGVVEEVLPEKQLKFKYVPFTEGTKPNDKNSLLVTIDLQSAANGTKVVFTEAGYNQLGMDASEIKENLEMNCNAWRGSLNSLKKLAES